MEAWLILNGVMLPGGRFAISLCHHRSIDMMLSYVLFLCCDSDLLRIEEAYRRNKIKRLIRRN